MSEPRIISPLLDGFALGYSMSCHSGVNCYPAMRVDSDERYIVKTISIPASQTQLEALLLTGAYPNAEAARSYFHELSQGIVGEIEILSKLAAQRGFVPYSAYQVDPMAEGVGYDVYLVSPYRRSLQRFLKRSPMTHLSAVNMGIDLCAALAVCREMGYLYVDLKPSNIYLSGEQEYHIGDLGFVGLDCLKYASLPDRYHSFWTPPEVADAYAELNDTMDTYALGLVLYQVYNNGELPFDSEESRQTLMQRMAAGEALPPPLYADYEMAQIIAKACAYDPAERWANPSEMGHALIAYMQRNGANDVAIGPPAAEPVLDTADADVQDEAEAVEVEAVEAESADIGPSDEAVESEPPEEMPEDAEAPQEETQEPLPEQTQEAETAEEPAEPAEDDWIDQIDAILAEEAPQADAQELTLRQLLENDDMTEDEAQAQLDQQELSDEIADMISQADELIAHEAPQPVDIPTPEPIVPDEEASEDPDAGEEAEAPDDTTEAEPDEDAQSDPPKPRKKGKRIIKWIIAIILLAALAAGGYYGYTNYVLQEIDSLTVTGESQTMTVSITTQLDESLLTVVCVDQYGTKLTAPVTDGAATFTDLTPDTQYNISLEVEGLRRLTGQTTAQHYTLPQISIVSFNAATGAENGTVILSFAAEGPTVENWTVQYVAEGMEPVSLSFSGTMATIPGLTPGTEYTFTLSAGDSAEVLGMTEITYTATNVIYAQNLALSRMQDGAVTATWTAPEGTSVDSWTARCYNEAGYDQTMNVTEPSATFTGLDTASAYTVEITAAGMTQSQRTYITANPINLTGLTVDVSGGVLSAAWEFEGEAPEGGWLLVYTIDHGTEQRVVQCPEAAGTISPLAPGSHYTVSVQAANSTTVLGGTAFANITEAQAFDQYALTADHISTKLYKVTSEGGSEETNTFASGDSVGVTLSADTTPDDSDDAITTLFVIRSSDGKLATISSSTANWSDLWKDGHCNLTVPQVPATVGTYTMQIYMNGQLVTTAEFNIQ